MSLADRASQLPTNQGNGCITCFWYDSQPDRDRTAFDDLIAREDISGAFLHRLCTDEGLECGMSSFRRHLDHHEPR